MAKWLLLIMDGGYDRDLLKRLDRKRLSSCMAHPTLWVAIKSLAKGRPFRVTLIVLMWEESMMEPTLFLGTTAASLVSSFLAKSIEELGKKTTGAAWEKAAELFHFVNQKLAGDPEGQKAITTVQSSPQDRQAQEHLALVLANLAGKDRDFATELSARLATAAQSGVDNLFNTNIAGNVEKFIQIQSVHGNISF